MTRSAFGLIGLFSVGIGASVCAAQGTCETAITVGNAETAGTLAFSIADPDDVTSCGADDLQRHWYRYVAGADGQLILTTCHPFTRFDSVIAVFDGCGGAEIACNDDDPAPICLTGQQEGSSSMMIPVVEGRSYSIRVSRVAGSDGDSYVLTTSGPPEPLGHTCLRAIPVSDETLIDDFADVPRSPRVVSCLTPPHSTDIAKWYLYQARATGSLTISTCHAQTQVGTVLEVYESCAPGAFSVACAAEPSEGSPACPVPGGDATTLSVDVTLGGSYLVRVSNAIRGERGTYEISFDGPEASGDECQEALVATDGTFIGDLVDNTGSTGDDSDGCADLRAGGDTIDEWYTYTARADGQLTVSTCSTDTQFNTVLSAKRLLAGLRSCGTGLSANCNDDAGVGCSPQASGGSSLTIDVEQGWEIAVRVSVYDDDFTSLGGHGTKYAITFDGPTPCACDWNQDFALNDQDFFDWVNDFFNQAGPRGTSDLNQDGIQNDQDWFDFINCFFAPPATCPN